MNEPSGLFTLPRALHMANELRVRLQALCLSPHRSACQAAAASFRCVQVMER